MATWNISISKCLDGRYELRLKIPGAPGGGHRSTRSLPPDFSDFVTAPADNKPSRKWRRDPASVDKDNLLFCAGDLDTLKEIGGRLYDSISHFGPEGEVEDLTNTFLALRAGADKAEGLGLRIDLTETPELSRIPWEALYLAKKDLFLGIDTRTNIVRHLESDSDGDLPPAVKPPIRMLVAVANFGAELEAGPEIANIERRLGSLPREDQHYAIETLERATRAELRGRIVKWKPHIIHFIGHGGFDDEKGLIFLHSGKDPAARDAIDSATLRDLVREEPPWLVVLNSCLSGAAARADPFGGAAQNLIRANIPFVVAMQAPISDDAAVQFSQDFYSALASGETVATAVSSGRNGIRTLEDEGVQPELITPVLYSTGKAERIAIRDPVPEIRKPSRWSMIDPGNQRLIGIATLVSMVVGILTLLWMSPSSQTREPSAVDTSTAAPAPDSGLDGTPAPDSDMMNGSAPDDQLLVESNAYDSAYAAAEGSAPGADFELRPVPPAPSPGTQAGSYPRAQAEEDPALTSALEDQILVEPAAAANDRPTAARQPSQQSSAAPRRPWRRVLRSTPPTSAVRARPTRPALFAVPEAAATAPSYYGIERNYAARRSARPYPYRDSRGNYLPARSGPLAPAGWRSQGPPPAYRSMIGLPVAVGVAIFPPDSAVPAQIEIRYYVAALAAPVDEALAVELVGTAAPGESATGGSEPGLARAEIVAAALRDSGIASERILVASAGDRWVPASYEPELLRAVEGRLVLRDAGRIGFATESAAVASEYAGQLDRVAAFARDNPSYRLKLEGHAQSTETDPLALSEQRIDSVWTELSRRGVDVLRMLPHMYGDTRPEVIGQPGPDADRRVQIVLIPPFVPDAPPPSAPPPHPPTRP